MPGPARAGAALCVVGFCGLAAVHGIEYAELAMLDAGVSPAIVEAAMANVEPAIRHPENGDLPRYGERRPAATAGRPVALAAALNLQPHVVLMDLHMPGMNGIEATRRLLAECPGVSVLVLTMFDDDESVFAAVRAGARGYLVKGAAQEQIVRAVRAVASGDVVFGSGATERVITFFAASGRIGARAGRRFPELTEREVEVLELIARGLNNAEIARRLVVSDKTVRNHVSSVFSKLHVDGRTYTGDSRVLANYYGWGEPLRAPADGMIAAVVDTFPDQPIGSVDRQNAPGNQVVIDIGSGKFVAYAHIQSGSITVSVGQRVRRGQVVGLVGNFGNTDLPHLHVQAQNNATFDANRPPAGFATYPMLFDDVQAERGSQMLTAQLADLRRGDRFATTS
jgi:DNA-binding NarL/FixJ family response regulator